MGLKLLIPPAGEPVSLDETKKHLRVELNEDDDLILSLVKAAREQAEVFTQRQLFTATWKATAERFPSRGWDCRNRLGFRDPDIWFSGVQILLPVPPLQSVSAIAYVDGNGATQTLDPSAYQVDADQEPGRVVPAFGLAWPIARVQPAAVSLTFVAGYGGAADVPAGIKTGIKMLVGHWYENREAVAFPKTGQGMPLPLAVETLFMAARWGGYA